MRGKQGPERARRARNQGKELTSREREPVFRRERDFEQGKGGIRSRDEAIARGKEDARASGRSASGEVGRTRRDTGASPARASQKDPTAGRKSSQKRKPVARSRGSKTKKKI